MVKASKIAKKKKVWYFHIPSSFFDEFNKQRPLTIYNVYMFCTFLSTVQSIHQSTHSFSRPLILSSRFVGCQSLSELETGKHCKWIANPSQRKHTYTHSQLYGQFSVSNSKNYYILLSQMEIIHQKCAVGYCVYCAVHMSSVIQHPFSYSRWQPWRQYCLSNSQTGCS